MCGARRLTRAKGAPRAPFEATPGGVATQVFGEETGSSAAGAGGGAVVDV